MSKSNDIKSCIALSHNASSLRLLEVKIFFTMRLYSITAQLKNHLRRLKRILSGKKFALRIAVYF